MQIPVGLVPPVGPDSHALVTSCLPYILPSFLHKKFVALDISAFYVSGTSEHSRAVTNSWLLQQCLSIAAMTHEKLRDTSSFPPGADKATWD